VKLFSCLNSESGSTEGSLIHFGYSHDYQFIEQMTEAIPDNGVGVMDRGFASREYLKKVESSNKLYVLRINGNYKIEYGEGDLAKLGTGEKAGWHRLVHFWDLETKVEYRLVTNLPYWEGSSKEVAISNAEIGEIYKQRWGIELLWKFLKMHLKLSRLMTKNKNGIEIQIYVTLVAYLLLQLVAIPKAWGEKLLDKLRYLQCCMNQELSYVHLLEKLLKFEPKRTFSGKVRLFAA
jgi:putative transposase